jgi:alanine racemase
MNRPPPSTPRIEVSLDNILNNLAEIRGAIGPAKNIMAVVKDLAYGCGSVTVSRTLEANGVSWLTVATAAEARTLRDGGITLPVLVLGACDKDELAWACENNVSISLNDAQDLAGFAGPGGTVRFHVNIDTGMGRLGLLSSELSEAVGKIRSTPRLVCEGAYTHLACADGPSASPVEAQLKKFRAALDLFRQNGISPRYIHYANSAALMRYPITPECNLVRPGITLYGCKPDPAQEFPLRLRPAVSLKAAVSKIKVVPAGTPVSYGGRYVTTRETHIATIPLGYGIGLPRKLTGVGSVLLGGRRYAIAGTVTMDYVMADIGPSTDVRVGDEAVAIGCQGTECITPDEVALQCGTIAYEILCGLSTRLDRYYILGGEVVEHVQGHYF